MKIFCYIALIILASVWMLRAQTSTNINTNAVNQILALVTTNAPASPPLPRTETLIEADGPADFDLTGRRVIYHDNVRVDAPNMKLRCEWLAADLPQNGGHVTNIVAETNVVIDAADDKGQKMHATSDKAVYVYNVQNGVTNETVTLTGEPAHLETAKASVAGNTIIWDRTRDLLSVPTNPKTVFRENFNGSVGGTNSSAMETNSLIVETNLLPAMTNQMTTPK